jgi:predicted adenylyl cyclase CyaB
MGSRAELVWYFRGDKLRSKRSEVLMFSLTDPASVKETLGRTLGVKAIVDKVRRVYLRDNVRVHFDEVRGLGKFVEIESVGAAKDFPTLRKQAEGMAQVLGPRPGDLIRESYSDLVSRTATKPTRGPT